MEKCIGCELCAGVCPARCIYVRGRRQPAGGAGVTGRALRLRLRDQLPALHPLRPVRRSLPDRGHHRVQAVRVLLHQPRTMPSTPRPSCWSTTTASPGTCPGRTGTRATSATPPAGCGPPRRPATPPTRDGRCGRASSATACGPAQAGQSDPDGRRCPRRLGHQPAGDGGGRAEGRRCAHWAGPIGAPAAASPIRRASTSHDAAWRWRPLMGAASRPARRHHPLSRLGRLRRRRRRHPGRRLRRGPVPQSGALGAVAGADPLRRGRGVRQPAGRLPGRRPGDRLRRRHRHPLPVRDHAPRGGSQREPGQGSAQGPAADRHHPRPGDPGRGGDHRPPGQLGDRRRTPSPARSRAPGTTS